MAQRATKKKTTEIASKKTAVTPKVKNGPVSIFALSEEEINLVIELLGQITLRSPPKTVDVALCLRKKLDDRKGNR